MCAAEKHKDDMEDEILSELARERDLQKYYQPWLDTSTSCPKPPCAADDEHLVVHASRDTTLIALAQLAALRLNVKRATVSLIDKDTQIILAEATKTLSLVDDSRHTPGDQIWLGQVSVPRRDALDEHVLGSKWTGRDSEGCDHIISALVVNDVAQDQRFKSRPYVVAELGVKFYAGVPITTKQGYDIGVYAVSDTRPHHDGLSVEQILFMQDVARIIAQHLERLKIVIDSESDEVFVRGMHNFIEGVSTIKHDQGSSPPEEFHASSDDRRETAQSTDPQEYATSDDHACEQSNDLPSEHSTDQPTREVLKSRESAANVIPKFSRQTSIAAKEGTEATTSNIKQVYQKAATCLREILNAQGCVILDASSGLFANSTDAENPQSVIGRTTGEFETDIEDESIDELEKAASFLGASFANDATLTMKSGLIKRKHFKTCLTRYPNGEHFYFEDGNPVLPPSSQLTAKSEANIDTTTARRPYRTHLPKQILENLAGSKWLVFLPLYNHATDQWCAGLFLWSNNEKVRDLGKAMAYFRTFGSCLVSEVASMDAFDTSAAKSTFIASISHDLRSPLHGILGSLEFLEDTMTTAYQTSLIGSIETCGRTLLDTIDHLLDYAKINNMNRSAIARGNKEASDRSITGKDHQETAPFDLGLLLEEVVEAVFAGQTFRKTQLRGQDRVDDAADKIRDLAIDDYKSAEDQIHAGSAKFSGRVFFILDIRRSKSWYMKGQTGGLRRVIMNVVGNAIKYCNKGTIEIVLSIPEINETTANVEISVNDTGIGMSQKYVENHLFKAFCQEDPFTPGAGLGLSIASQVIQTMNGRVHIKSEKGVGTHATISLPMEIADPGTWIPDTLLYNAERAATGQEICMLNPLQDSDEAENGQVSKLTASIAHTCEDWFGMKSFQAQKITDDQNASVYVYCEPPPIEYLLQNHTERKVSGKTGKEAALLIICTNAFEAAALRAAGVTQLTNLGRIIEVISQPVGVRKLAKTVLQSLQRIEAVGVEETKLKLSKPMKQIYESHETAQRADEVGWKTSTSVYDHVLARHRPSIERYHWKSEQFAPKSRGDDETEKSIEFGDIKAGRSPELAPAAGTNHSNAARLPCVLVVDDNAINLKLLVTFMKKIKLPYAEAVNGLEAFNKFKEAEQQFDFVLMDLQMPVMDGLESTRKIRELERETKVEKPSTIIAITGVGNEATRREAADAGMTQYLTKPVKFKALQQMLEKDINP